MAFPLSKANEVFQFLEPLNISKISDFGSLPEIVGRFPPHTLLTKDFFEAMLSATSELGSIASMSGDWVQVGVWKGGGALFLRALMKDLGVPSRLHLYDTFDGCRAGSLSQPEDKAFSDALALTDVTDSYEQAARSLLGSFDLSEKVHFHKGDIRQADKSDVPDEISLLHLDVDFYEPTLSALQLLYECVVPGGIILIDDYYLDLVNCRQAVDDFFLGKGIADSAAMKRFSSFALIITKP
jgi:macrocin-O-methyltransferase TylF-like protien